MNKLILASMMALLWGCASSQPPRDCSKECAEAVALDQEANNVLKAELGKMRELITKARDDYDAVMDMVCTGQPFGGDKVCFAMPVTAYATSCQQGRPPEFSIPAKTIVRIGPGGGSCVPASWKDGLGEKSGFIQLGN